MTYKVEGAVDFVKLGTENGGEEIGHLDRLCMWSWGVVVAVGEEWSVGDMAILIFCSMIWWDSWEDLGKISLRHSGEAESRGGVADL